MSEYRPFWYQLKRNLCVDDYKLFFFVPQQRKPFQLHVRFRCHDLVRRPYFSGFCEKFLIADGGMSQKTVFFINPFGC